MPVHMSTLQLLGAPAVVLVVVVWAGCAGLALRRRRRYEAATRRWVRSEDALRRRRELLGGLPRQQRRGPEQESVELTPAEQDAFAFLMRQFRDGRS
ncbi:hypothetical protein ACIHAA_22305 [Streptomyces sp. NPDC052040]|uniref:hypothetical protein n=1 Tax=unclassified Streptomyces TaxID=2593676 RepID=UPI0037D77B53